MTSLLDVWASRPTFVLEQLKRVVPYPALPSAQKHRRIANSVGSIAAMALADQRAYGEAVLKGIRGLQRTALARELPSNKCPCASGTWHSDGKKILDAVKRQHRA